MYTYYLMKLQKGNNLQKMFKNCFHLCKYISYRNCQRKKQEITKKTKETIWSECKNVFVYMYTFLYIEITKSRMTSP